MTHRQASNEQVFPRQGSQPTPADGRPIAPVAARFDPPHPMRVVDAATVPPIVDPSAAAGVTADPRSQVETQSESNLRAGALPVELREQLCRQATELADHLRQEAGCVDRREAQLHARLAELDQQIRSATLWLSDQRADIERRSEQLETRELALKERESNVQSAERFLDAARRQTEQRLAELTAAIEARTQEAASQDSIDAAVAASPGQWIHIERAWTELGARQDRLAQAERVLQERQGLLETQRLQIAEQVRQLRASIARQRDEVRRQTASAKRSLARRMHSLDERRRGLDRLHSQVKARYREALRIRLATERLCGEAVGPEGAALLQRAAADARLRLEDCDRREEAVLAKRAASIEKTRMELVRRQTQLAAQQEKLSAWYQDRLAELAARGLSGMPMPTDVTATSSAQQTA